MTNCIVWILFTEFFICLINTSNAQTVNIAFKDGTEKTETITANSDSQLFIKGGSIKYSTINSVYFATDRPVDKTLHESLSIAGIKIFIAGAEKIIDVNQINSEPKKGTRKLLWFVLILWKFFLKELEDILL